ncbi:carbamoyl phosphate synthase large subunit, partial [Pasteurella multocida 2000]
MPKRTDINTILIIGAGPIVIGQACEFDYSGAQACKALREEGYKVVLVNSNPATIMTDPDMADVTYIEPIEWRTVEKIIEKERPDAILPTMGGQTALNCALDLSKNGVLKKYNVELIGAKEDAIDKAEDRGRFKEAMEKIGLSTPKSFVCHTLEEAWAAQSEVGFPTLIRPSFTMGGSGGGIAYNKDEFYAICERGFDASPTHELLIEQSVLGWKEYEMEVVRDKADNCIIVCSIENFDPMGVHTGDSITVAPAQTLTDKEYQIMRNASIAVLREIGVDTGGSNVQFAINPENGEMIVIEMNPRVSRSSALASKATGFPIAKVAAKLAVGYTLNELRNDITGGLIPASFEPSIDYVVTKVPRFAFEKFPQADDRLTTQMKSVGEVMAMGRTFQESLQKALRGLETGICGFNLMSEEPEKIRQELGNPGPIRILYVADAFGAGFTLDEVHHYSKIDPWFLIQIQDLVLEELALEKRTLDDLDYAELRRLKRKGFSDKRIAQLTKSAESAVRNKRVSLNLHPVYKRVDTCAGEFTSDTAYLYSTYEEECESRPSDKKKIMILGGGPNRIGQGIEFDYCCVHASLALREAGFETIMVNCNPETVSTDFDTSDRLYFEPLTLEDVLEIIHVEKPHGVIVHYGGQTPLKLANDLHANGVNIIGTSADSIDAAEDRERFQQILHKLHLKQPTNRTARNAEEAVKLAEEVGYPLVVRPSYVLGGRAMQIVYNVDELQRYMREAVSVSNDSPILLDHFLNNAIEVDVD